MGTRYGGAGLGLYIVRRLVELLHGTITLDSAVAAGATFRMCFPIDAAAPGHRERDVHHHGGVLSIGVPASQFRNTKTGNVEGGADFIICPRLSAARAAC